MNIKRSSASRGELTKAMSATLREVRLHHDQIAAALAGIQQLMDGQAALGEAFEALKREVEDGRREAFSAGYHCQWFKADRKYIFDHKMSPGDDDGAFTAWLESKAVNG